jgi:hypothetical protein
MSTQRIRLLGWLKDVPTGRPVAALRETVRAESYLEISGFQMRRVDFKSRMSGDGTSVSLRAANTQRSFVSSGCQGALGELMTRVPTLGEAAAPVKSASPENSHAQSSCELGASDGVESGFCS